MYSRRSAYLPDALLTSSKYHLAPRLQGSLQDLGPRRIRKLWCSLPFSASTPLFFHQVLPVNLSPATGAFYNATPALRPRFSGHRTGLTRGLDNHPSAARLYLAFLTAAMTRPRKDDGANASPSTAKTTYKRKRKPGEERYYAVRSGRIPGVYTTWQECQSMITGFAGAQCKLLSMAQLPPTHTPSLSPLPPRGPTVLRWACQLTNNPIHADKAFPSQEEAALFAAGKNPNPNTAPDRFYAVAVGNRPGIYTEWADAQAAYTGVKAPKYRKFDTREAAQEWMATFVQEGPSMTYSGDADADEDEDDEEDFGLPSDKKMKNNMQMNLGGPASGELEEIYTDGSTLSNGQEGAVAGVGVFFGDGDPRFVPCDG